MAKRFGPMVNDEKLLRFTVSQHVYGDQYRD